MEILKKFDAQNYKDTTSVFEKYTNTWDYRAGWKDCNAVQQRGRV